MTEAEGRVALSASRRAEAVALNWQAADQLRTSSRRCRAPPREQYHFRLIIFAHRRRCFCAPGPRRRKLRAELRRHSRERHQLSLAPRWRNG